MTKPRNFKIEPVPCHNCGDPVRRTKPSSVTSRSFCAKAECQKERARLYQADRRAQMAVEARVEASAELEEARAQTGLQAVALATLRDIVSNRLLEEAGETPVNFRSPCPECGFTRAIIRISHPGRGGACRRLADTRLQGIQMMTPELVVWLFGPKEERVWEEV